MAETYYFSLEDLGKLTDKQLENHKIELLKRHSGHPSGSSSHARSQAALYLVDYEITRRQSEYAKNEFNKTYKLSLNGYNLDKIILVRLHTRCGFLKPARLWRETSGFLIQSFTKT